MFCRPFSHLQTALNGLGDKRGETRAMVTALKKDERECEQHQQHRQDDQRA
jgi:hypothetical protein